MGSAGPELTPEPIAVGDDVLDDLRRRLLATNWPLDEGNEDGWYGVPRAMLEDLVTYWADGYDWRAAERAMNEYEHYKVEISGVPVHFMRKAGVGPSPVPLILSHGWPWTFWHWSKVVDRLADPAASGGDPREAFDVIVPSLPGFGYSTPTSPDMSFSKMADVFHELMRNVLGHDRYAAAGFDMGAFVTAQLGHKYADEVYGIQIGGSGRPMTQFNGDRAWNISGGHGIPDDLPEPIRRRISDMEHRWAVHLATHILEPSTIAYGLTDSPAGMLAWILARFIKWSDTGGDLFSVYTRDDILTQATIFWTGQSIASSIRAYANNNRYPWTPSHSRQPVVEAPTGITMVAFENPPGVSTPEERVQQFIDERGHWYNYVNLRAHEKGGHFVPWEIPDEFVDDLLRTLRPYLPR
jgi:pimeloyl-ACP methyl ester carboxylesterase